MRPAGVSEISGDELGRRLLARQPDGRLPLIGQWELTCRCNLTCVMCYTDPFNTPEQIRQELSTAEVIRILDELREAGCVELCLTGGEPFARPDFLEIYTAAKLRGFLLTIFTNGTLLTPRIADHLKAYPPRMIEISFHGYTAASFDSITQVPGSFERCRRGIQLLLERGLPVTLKSLGMTVNREEVLKIKAWVESLGGVQYKFGADMRPRLDGSEDPYQYQLPEEEIAAIEDADREMCEERKRKLLASEKGPAPCAAAQIRFHIDAYGQLHLCSNNRRGSYDLRSGSFREGFYEFLPRFPCPRRPIVPVGELRPPRGAAPAGRER